MKLVPNKFLERVKNYVPLTSDEEIEKRLIEEGYTRLSDKNRGRKISIIDRNLEVSDYFVYQNGLPLMFDIEWMISNGQNLDAIKELLSFPKRSKESLKEYFKYKVNSHMIIYDENYSYHTLYEGEFKLVRKDNYLILYEEDIIAFKARRIILHNCYVNGVKEIKDISVDDVNYNYPSSGVTVKIDTCDNKEKIRKYIINWPKNPTHKSYDLISHQILDLVLHVDDKIYKFLKEVGEVTFEKDISFKTTNPGEQMTNTFNVLVLEDNSEWYDGKYYNL